jgi:hypothetical protein
VADGIKAVHKLSIKTAELPEFIGTWGLFLSNFWQINLTLSFSEKATKFFDIFLMVLTFTE